MTQQKILILKPQVLSLKPTFHKTESSSRKNLLLIAKSQALFRSKVEWVSTFATSQFCKAIKRPKRATASGKFRLVETRLKMILQVIHGHVFSGNWSKMLCKVTTNISLTFVNICRKSSSLYPPLSWSSFRLFHLS